MTRIYGVENWPRPSISRPDEIGKPLVTMGAVRVLPEADLDGIEDVRFSRPVPPLYDVNAPDHTSLRNIRRSVSRDGAWKRLTVTPVRTALLLFGGQIA